MKYKFRLIASLLCLVVIPSCWAQQSNIVGTSVILSDSDKEEFTTRIKQKIDDFQKYLEVIGGKHNYSSEIKDEYTTFALNLFIGEGDDYYEYVATPYGDQQRLHAAVKMQTTSKSRGKNPPQPMKRYLSRLRQLNYDKIEVTQADAVRVDNIQKAADGKYIAVAYMCQRFIGYRDGIPVIDDYDIKKITVYINQVSYQVPGQEENIVIWEAKLGDVMAHESW